MRKRFMALFFALGASACLMMTGFASSGEQSAAPAVPFGERLLVAGKLFGTFVLMMAVLFGVLLLSKKIAAWIDKHKT